MLELRKLFPEKEDFPIVFDAIKVSHHGSFRNNNPKLFEMIDSPKFLFSTNGKHPRHTHPDFETLAVIVCRTCPLEIIDRELIFNYELPHLKDFDDEELKARFKYSIKITDEIIV